MLLQTNIIAKTPNPKGYTESKLMKRINDRIFEYSMK